LRFPAETGPDLRRMFDDVVTRCLGVLRICIGVLRDVTVLAEMTGADEPTDFNSPSLRSTCPHGRPAEALAPWLAVIRDEINGNQSGCRVHGDADEARLL
jgi:hypothetical protein